MKEFIFPVSEEDYGEDYKWIEEHNNGELVRCKDCVHGEHCLNGAGEEAVECYNDYSFGDIPLCHIPEFYCYDAVKRDGR